MILRAERAGFSEADNPWMVVSVFMFTALLEKYVLSQGKTCLAQRDDRL